MPGSKPGATPKFDFAFSVDIAERHDYLGEEARRILHGSASQLAEAGITASPTVSLDRMTVSYTVAVDEPEKLDLKKWGFQVAHFLYDVRATLDNIMWLVVHDRPLGALTPRQEEHVYFPMAREEEYWRSFVAGPIAKVIRPALLARLEDVQPFKRPGHQAIAGLTLLSKIHLSDKHRDRMTLQLLPDAQMPPPLFAPAARHDLGEMWVQLGNLSRPITVGGHLKTIRYVAPIAGEPNTVPLRPVPMVVFGGERYDLQDVMWDAQAALLRVVDTVCLGNTFRSDLWDADVAWRREAVAALNRSLADGTAEWERRGFNRPSPFVVIGEELSKDNPDFDMVFPVDQ